VYGALVRVRCIRLRAIDCDKVPDRKGAQRRPPLQPGHAGHTSHNTIAPAAARRQRVVGDRNHTVADAVDSRNLPQPSKRHGAASSAPARALSVGQMSAVADEDRTHNGLMSRRALMVVSLFVVLVISAGAGGFFVGESTRKSDQQVARERTAAVSSGVAAKGAEVKTRYLAIMERAEKKIKDRNKVVLRRVVKRLKKQAEREAQQSFASGSQSGFSSGRDAGVEEGVLKASDELTCSDDLDVALPYCNY
jgi:hypothetical protein